AIAGNFALRQFCFYFSAEEDSNQLDIRVPSGTPNPYFITDRELREQAYSDAVGILGIMTTCYFALALVQTLIFCHKLSLTFKEMQDLSSALRFALSFANKLVADLSEDLGVNLYVDFSFIPDFHNRQDSKFLSDGSNEHNLASVLVLSFALKRHF